MLAALQVRDEVEEARHELAERCSCALADLKADLEFVGVGALFNSDVPAQCRERQWTLELIYEAAVRGLQDIPQAAQLMLQAEDVELSDEAVRRVIRANAESKSEVREPLADVDKPFMDSIKECLTGISDKHKKVEVFKQNRTYADLVARDARCWSASTDRTGQGRAIPKAH